ncbi:MAG: hypothetical protein O2888_01770, partial [Chloroflexi bacterium]|nr:hypothetical protein [Chloroflexota bacterium]
PPLDCLDAPFDPFALLLDLREVVHEVALTHGLRGSTTIDVIEPRGDHFKRAVELLLEIGFTGPKPLQLTGEVLPKRDLLRESFFEFSDLLADGSGLILSDLVPCGAALHKLHAVLEPRYLVLLDAQ